MKEYSKIGPISNLSESEYKCLAEAGGCGGSGLQANGKDKCLKCSGSGKLKGALAEINDAAKLGWKVISHVLVGHPPINHLFLLERDVPEDTNAAK